MMKPSWLRILRLWTFVLVGLVATRVDAKPKVWVCTIAVNTYKHLKPDQNLRWCISDAQNFVDRLKGCDIIERNSDCLLQFLPTGTAAKTLAESDRIDPTTDNIREHLPKFLSRASEEDTVIIFAALHGANSIAKNGVPGESFLLPVDFKPDLGSASAIPLKWLRTQLTGKDDSGKMITKARKVLLFLDACHAGGIGAVASPNWEKISTRAIELEFHQTDGTAAIGDRNIYTLVSCGEDQTSAEYAEFRQGIFSYWLGVGLEGAADANGDAQVTMDELFQFLSRQVGMTASYLKTKDNRPVEQTPQRFLLGTRQDDPVLVFKLPIINSARPAFERAKMLLHALLENYARGRGAGLRLGDQPPRVLITEFSDKVLLGGELGSFGAVARGVLEEKLMERQGQRPAPAYEITSQSALAPKLRGIELETLISDFAETLPKATPGAEILVQGSFLRLIDQQYGDRLQLRLQITNLVSGTSIASVPITFIVNDDIQKLLPHSHEKQNQLASAVPIPPKTPFNSPQTNLPTVKTPEISDSPIKNAPATPATQEFIPAPVLDFKQQEQQANDPHPLRNPRGPTPPVRIYQGLPGSIKTPVEWLPEDMNHRNLLAFETTAGQELEIQIKNPSPDKWYAVIVQIDGLNQIGQSPQLPLEARYWLLPPNSEARIDQWLDNVPVKEAFDGKSFEVEGNKLLVTSPPDSVAGRTKLSQSLGEIRILAFGTEPVHPGSKSAISDVGIGAGTRGKSEFMLHRHWQIDRARDIGTYVIKYQKKKDS